MVMRKLIRNRKGQGLVEYALIIAGVALIGTVGITMFGHKVADLIGTVAAILPGAHTDDNAPIVAGHLIETDNNGPGGSIETQREGVINRQWHRTESMGTCWATEVRGDSPLVERNPVTIRCQQRPFLLPVPA